MPVERFVRFTCDQCGQETTIPGDRQPTRAEQEEVERILVVSQGNRQFILCRPLCLLNFFRRIVGQL